MENDLSLQKVRLPIDRLTAPIVKFLHIEAAGGIVLLIATIAALTLAQLPVGATLAHFWHLPISVGVGNWSGQLALEAVINDGLMAIFFFVVGLEVKREIVVGELKTIRKALLPIAAAIGGMVAPALVYITLEAGTVAPRGWAIPMATDIAFVVGAMSLLSSRVPHGLRILLLSLAIVDDIGAVLVIAFGYTESIFVNWLVYGLCGALVFGILLHLGVKSRIVLGCIGIFVWACFLQSGVHATIAGVLLGLLTPARNVSARYLRPTRFPSSPGTDPFPLAAVGQPTCAEELGGSPAENIQNILHPWVSFVIMPLFAFANAGVPIVVHQIGEPVSIGVALGLVVGKPLGILAACFLAVKLGLAALPSGVNTLKLLAGGCLSGIGFTMALFIASLALSGVLLAEAKIGILMGSFISALLGFSLLWISGVSKTDNIREI